MATYNRELEGNSKETLSAQEKDRAYSLFYHFLSDLNIGFQRKYHIGFKSKEEHVKFMKDKLVLKHFDSKIAQENGIGEQRSLICTQESCKVFSLPGDFFRIKQLVSFSREDLKYFSDAELEEVKTNLAIDGFVKEDIPVIEEVYEILDKENFPFLTYDRNLSERYYTILEATLPRKARREWSFDEIEW